MSSMNVSCRLPIDTIDQLTDMSTEIGNRKRSHVLDTMLRHYKLELTISQIDGSEDWDTQVISKNKKKMMTFSLSREARDNLVGMSNATYLSQAQVIEVLTEIIANQNSEE